MTRSVRHCLAAAFVLAFAGCAGGPPPPPASTINVSDGNVFQPVVRATVNIPGPRGAASDPHTGHAIEFGFTRGSGESSQDLRSNYVAFGGQQFNPPAALDCQFTLTYLDFSYRFRAFEESGRVGIEALGGLAVADFDLSVSSASQRASEGLSSPGAQLGLGVIWRMRRGSSAHVRGTYFYSGDFDGVTEATRVELYFQQALLDHVTLRAGYAWWSLQSERGSNISPINVEFRGPTLGLEVMF